MSVEPEVRLSFAQIAYLKRITERHRTELTEPWCRPMLPFIDEVIEQLDRALDQERERAIAELAEAVAAIPVPTPEATASPPPPSPGSGTAE